MTMHSYEIKIIGSLGPATREAFADLVVQVEPTITVLSGDLDQSSLHEVLDRVRALGLELIEIKQAPDGRPALVHAIRQTPELAGAGDPGWRHAFRRVPRCLTCGRRWYRLTWRA